MGVSLPRARASAPPPTAVGRPRRRAWLARGVLALVAVVVACSDRPTLIEPRAHVNPAFVTGEAAAALQPDGRFALAPAVTTPPGELNAEQAKLIAVQFVVGVAPFLLNRWIAEHGRTITPATLAPCDRALYAANPYEPLSPALSELTVRTFGPHWVVPLCAPGGQAQIVVTFSSLATEVAEDLNGNTGILHSERSDIQAFGLPKGAASGMYSPEAAAAYAYTKTGQRVSTVPKLLMTPMPQVPALVRWNVSLERPITLKGKESGASRQRATLFVGFTDRFTVSGLLDRNPSAAAQLLPWIDGITKGTFTPVPLSSAPVGVEIVMRKQP